MSSFGEIAVLNEKYGTLTVLKRTSKFSKDLLSEAV